jgi:ribonuclease T
MAEVGWDSREAHSAIYDAEQTAKLFCKIVNRWRELDPVRIWEIDSGQAQRGKA